MQFARGRRDRALWLYIYTDRFLHYCRTFVIVPLCFLSCRQFAEACGHALDVNERLIKEDQFEYQGEMKSHYKDMLSELSVVMNEQVRTSISVLVGLNEGG